MSNRRLAFVFPGQGSQSVGMGRDLYDNVEEARKLFDHANQVLGFDVAQVMLNGPEEDLKQTIYTQPAVVLVSVALDQVLRSRGIEPVIVAGHSLGEYSAICSSGVLDFDSVIQLVETRAKLMQEAGKSRPGTMAAVLGLDDAKLAELCAESDGIVVVANHNAPGQTVLSGEVEALNAVLEKCKAAGAKRALPLPVSGAFHSPLMDDASAMLNEKIEQVQFNDPSVPLVANVDGKPHSSAQEIKELLRRQMTSSVLWTTCVQSIIDFGVDAIVEVGSGNVLTGLIKRSIKDIPLYNVTCLADIDKL